jgi:hypothetical protein
MRSTALQGELPEGPPEELPVEIQGVATMEVDFKFAC